MKKKPVRKRQPSIYYKTEMVKKGKKILCRAVEMPSKLVLKESFFEEDAKKLVKFQNQNKTFGKFQDDAEYDPDDEAKFVLNQWYKLYEQAENPNTGVFDYKRLELLQANFWTRKTPEGLLYNNFRGYITRNTSNTKHPEPYKNLLSRTNTNRWIIA